MSETNQSIRPLPRPQFQEMAKAILLRFAGGERKVTVTLSLPEGYPELRVAVSKRTLPFSSRLKVSIDKDSPCCLQCRQTVEKIRGQETQAGLADILQDVTNIIEKCKCMAVSLPAAAGETGQSPLRIQPSGMRVKVIPSDETATASTPVQEMIRLKRSKGITVVDDGVGTGVGVAEDSFHEKYTAPSIRFQPGLHAQVEVTIPRYVCEALMLHCRQSNRHKREVGGVLVGYQGEIQDEMSGLKIYAIMITDLIHFMPTDSSGAHLRLDANSWVYVSQIYEEKFMPRNKVRLGWYHTHPTQGIFFSSLDHDFHTNFNQPFQFAVVVDPRDMYAGLIYWKSYDNRITDAPIIFSLKRRSSTIVPVGGRQHLQSSDESLPLSWVRLFFFTAVTFTVLTYVMSQSSWLSMSPPYACLLALNLLIGLRLLNANFFRPKERVEDRAIAALRGWIWAVLDQLETKFGHRRVVGFMYLMAAIILLISLLLFKGIWTSPGNEMPTRKQMTGQTQASADSVSSVPKRSDGLLRLILVRRRNTLSLVMGGGSPRVTFRQGPRGQWEPIDVEEEKTFLSQGLALDASINEPSDSVRMLQQELYGEEKASEKRVDGIWGDQIRNALLGELIKVQKGGKEWRLPWSDEQSRFMIVNSAPEPNSSRTERLGHVARRTPRKPRAPRRR